MTPTEFLKKIFRKIFQEFSFFENDLNEAARLQKLRISKTGKENKRLLLQTKNERKRKARNETRKQHDFDFKVEFVINFDVDDVTFR